MDCIASIKVVDKRNYAQGYLFIDPCIDEGNSGSQWFEVWSVRAYLSHYICDKF